MDNCWRENKNRFVLGYCCYLAQQGVFKHVVANFFTVGHTHSDPDQMFSRISVNLHTNNAITLQDLYECVKCSMGNSYLLDYGYLENVPNLSGLMEDGNWLNNMTGIYHY